MAPDYNYYSPESIRTATEGINAEAKKWFGFSDTMEKIAQNMADTTLEPTAFAVIDISTVITATDQHNAYKKTQEWLTGLFRDAVTKMDKFGEALKKCADEYDRTDGQSAASFDAIAKSQ